MKEVLGAFLIEGTFVGFVTILEGGGRRFIRISDIHSDFFLLRHFGCFVEDKMENLLSLCAMSFIDHPIEGGRS